MKKTLLIALFFGVTNLFAQKQQDSILDSQITTIKDNVFQQRQQIDALTKKLKNQQFVVDKQSQSIETLKTTNKSLNASIDSLSQVIAINSRNIETNSNQLGTEIEKVTSITNSKLSELDNSVGKNRLYWIIATLITLLLGSLVYWLLGKRIDSSKTDLETQIEQTKTELENKSKELDNKLVEIYDKQLKILEELIRGLNFGGNEKTDHSLALKVADEIVRMQKNISKMDEGTKNLKALVKGIERIQDNFSANGYEMINHLNGQYDERFNIDVINFITDENLEEGHRIITAVIKPQVNYNGVLIQRAQVDVSQS